jgi:hypothetical protein
MIDLTRRNFIKNVGFVGTTTLFCGSLLAQNTFTNFSNPDKEEENILSKFSKSTHSDAFLLDQNLLDCYNKTIVSWKGNGYESSGNFCYSSQDGHLKMFPMHLHINGAEKLDAVLLCFGKNSNGEWKTLKSLSGFDLEAINIAMKELQINNKNVDLSHYFFPAPTQKFDPYRFETNKGSVSLKTILSPEKTSTTIIVKERSRIVYQKEIVSQHTLSVGSILV